MRERERERERGREISGCRDAVWEEWTAEEEVRTAHYTPYRRQTSSIHVGAARGLDLPVMYTHTNLHTFLYKDIDI